MANEKNKFLTPSLPLAESRELDYKYVDNYGDLIRQNFKNLILTIPGERVMNSDFGVGIQRYLFESSINASSGIKERVTSQAKKYMPFVNVSNVLVQPSESGDTITVRIFYAVPSLAIEEYINLSFDTDGALVS